MRRRVPDYLFSHTSYRRLKLDGPTLLQQVFEAVRPRIGYQEWRSLENYLPDKIEVLGCTQSGDTVLASIAAHVANSHDITVLPAKVHDSTISSRYAEFHFTISISWTDNDSWLAESAAMEMRISLRKQGSGWRIAAIGLLNTSALPLTTALMDPGILSPACGRILVCTTATERRSGLADLEQSCARMGIPLYIFGKGVHWRGFNHLKIKGFYWELEKHSRKYVAMAAQASARLPTSS